MLKPSFIKDLQVFSVDMCSILDVIMWFPSLLFLKATPFIARFMLSVPPDVKIISFSGVSAFMSSATFSLAFVRASFTGSLK